MGDLPAEAQAILDRARGEVPELGGIDQPTEAFAPVPEENGEAPSSLIRALRDQHRRIAQRTSTIIELPFWDGLLAVRYRYLDERSLGRLLSLVQSASDPNVVLQANTDLLIGGCDEVLARPERSAEWGPPIEGEHLRFDERLAEALQLDAEPNARSVVHALFHGRVRGAMAIGAHAARYIEWLQGVAPEVATELQGESPTPGS